MLRALLIALLAPISKLREAEATGDYTTRLALLEEAKLLPAGAVWDHYCEAQGVPVAEALLHAHVARNVEFPDELSERLAEQAGIHDHEYRRDGHLHRSDGTIPGAPDSDPRDSAARGRSDRRAEVAWSAGHMLRDIGRPA